MKNQISIFCLLLMAGIAIAVETTNDPLQYFKNRWDLEGVTKIYKLEADINNDGLNDVFLAINKSDPPEEAEIGWEFYYR